MKAKNKMAAGHFETLFTEPPQHPLSFQPVCLLSSMCVACKILVFLFVFFPSFMKLQKRKVLAKI